ncbi:spore coat protein U domain-containing protein [Neorhizobium galegae]|uniref:Spore coat protein U domain-containing protein n=1 Tax=Neorhizobium galegae TaxID=399 RepID=A0A6A1TLD3_NEOGA|nr:spore coat protein U domain-containing protein [Neorhizobium galegae]KAB1082374.1 spore coat protein U domain-containing protein [Neorhizobium galegae]
MKSFFGRFLPILVLCVLTGVGAARAQSCDFAIANINFGTVTLLGGGAVDVSTTIDVACRNTLNLSLQLRICPNINAGSGGTSGADRYMRNGANQPLSFSLFQNGSRTVPWGSVTQTALGSPPPIDILLLPLTTTNTQVSLYARLNANQQTALGGSYLSTFAGAETRFNYQGYTLLAPACTAVTQNPTQPSFTVQAFVNRTCNVTAQGINFGARGVIASRVDSTGQLAVTCTQNLPYAIALDGGISNGTATARKMRKGTETITYGLYQDAARTQPWGNTTGQTVSGTGTGTAQNLTVYGRVEAQNTPSPGTYNDTVVVTVTY